jgi:gamma-glutamyltranspeptidase/glutathione hydrolase
MTNIVDTYYSSTIRPPLRGRRGAIAAAHPLAAAAGQELLAAGGSAADALIAAQAVLCVVAPEACGLGGDMLALIDEDGLRQTAVTGAGAAPIGLKTATMDGANSVTVPGIVSAWESLATRWTKLPLSRALAPAIAIAREGFEAPVGLKNAVTAQRHRLERGGAAGWSIVSTPEGRRIKQPELAMILSAIAERGAAAFYSGQTAEAIVRALASGGGAMALADLSAHRTEFGTP